MEAGVRSWGAPESPHSGRLDGVGREFGGQARWPPADLGNPASVPGTMRHFGGAVLVDHRQALLGHGRGEGGVPEDLLGDLPLRRAPARPRRRSCRWPAGGAYRFIQPMYFSRA